MPGSAQEAQQQHHGNCAYCHRRLDRIPSIQCVDCVAVPPLELCIQCFSAGVEISDHKKDHRYKVKDNKSAIKVFNDDWSAFEELALLSSIEKHGFGNWKDIAVDVGSKNERRCEEHYLEHYLGRFGCILPAQAKRHGVLVDTDDFLPEEDQVGTKRRRLGLDPEPPVAASATAPAVAPLSPTSGPPLGPEWDPPPGTPFQREKFRDHPKATQAQVLEKIQSLPGAGLLGYMPLRGDFDAEHDNDAETLLAEMEISPTDPPEELKLKLEVLRIFNARLDERERRKRFVVERNLFDFKKIQLADRKRPQDERELVARLRVFARFHSAEEHEKFVEGILEAKRIRKRIQELQEYRRLGIRTLNEAQLYEGEKRAALDALASGEPDSAGGSQRVVAVTSSSSSTRDDGSTRYVVRRTGEWEKAQNEAADESTTTDADFLRQAPGADLLSDKEKQLCTDLRLMPKHYMAIKDALITESIRLGYLARGQARALLSVDVSKTGEIFDFFVSCGWLREDDP
eukprot:CAMPEP_0118984516 /NCGR_PEP_ID=MMETSP1173-20130426/37931_1 /TAXON_ID=1034831 /ORGANISM="Rhizochromulina marina cf, Strain CCMP1243" /LENGTH=513 /DNA_ID=CAMNT_0006935181 /DNA_START=97 /DNA_END=1634 /DNA_ORIENTATION=+